MAFPCLLKHPTLVLLWVKYYPAIGQYQGSMPALAIWKPYKQPCLQKAFLLKTIKMP